MGRTPTIGGATMLVAIFVLLPAGTTAGNDPNLAVCRDLKQQYARLARATEQRDLEAIVALRTPDFSARGSDGRQSTFAEMVEYSRRLLSAMRPPIELENTILTLSVQGDTSVVDVLQEFSRRQLTGGVERALETSVIQRETWRRTPDGWRLAFVDDVDDRRWSVDGKRIDPDRPYDPEAPEFRPDDPPRPEKTAACGLPEPEG